MGEVNCCILTKNCYSPACTLNMASYLALCAEKSAVAISSENDCGVIAYHGVAD